jgi:hypothetical protein
MNRINAVATNKVCPTRAGFEVEGGVLKIPPARIKPITAPSANSPIMRYII